MWFPGAIGWVDCASWEWDACPVAWQVFQILYRPSRLWHKSDMLSTVEACAIINNMVVCKRRETYTGTVSTRVPED
jgi:Plant transposon protein